MVSFSIRYPASLSIRSRFSERSSLALSYAFLSIATTSSSMAAAVWSEQLRDVRPSRYWLSTVANPASPNLSLIPKRVIIFLAMDVAFSISLAAPVVTLPNTISSAARPPRAETIMFSSSSLELRYFSSSGTCITYPRAPIVLGTMVIF